MPTRYWNIFILMKNLKKKSYVLSKSSKQETNWLHSNVENDQKTENWAQLQKIKHSITYYKSMTQSWTKRF